MKILAALLASTAVLSAAVDACAQAGTTLKVELGGASHAVRSLSLPRGKSAVIDLPVDARDVLVSDPKVADAVLRTPRRIYVLGVNAGQTDAVFFDANGRQILALDIRVDQPTSAIQETIKRVAPDSDVKVEAVSDSLVLTGNVASSAESSQIQRIAERFVSKPEQVVNTLSIRGAEQVMIKVRVVEMQRNLIKQLGFDTNALIGRVGMSQFSLANAAQFAVNNGLMGGLSGGYGLDTTQQPELQVPCSSTTISNCFDVINKYNTPNQQTATTQTTSGSPGVNKASALIKAFERAGLVRSLAEPNLTAVSGENAKFLAGGEFPIPSGVDQNGNVIVVFKPYGVALAFTPVVLSQGRISLKVSTEVSELSTGGELKFNNSLTIPALTVRRAESTVELPSGGAIMMAGLLKEETQEDIDSLPGLTNLPVLGTLFRSRDYLKGETELVIIVETYLAKSVRPDQLQTAADGLVVASDVDTVLMGRLNKAYHDKSAPQSAWQGPVGYVIE